MKVIVRFFGRYREIVGERRKELEVGENAEVKDILDPLMREYPNLNEEKLIVALNHKRADQNVKLKENDIVAILPPVSGG